MRGVVMHAPGDVRTEELDMPVVVEPTDAIIRVTATCICGSDLWPYRGIEKLNGTVEGLPQMERMRLRYNVRGPSLKRLAPIFGVPLLETPPYAVSGQLERAGGRWETTDMRGKVGNSDLAGHVIVQTGTGTPQLEARFKARFGDRFEGFEGGGGVKVEVA